MAGKAAADHETPADGGDPPFDLQKAAVEPALSVAGTSDAVARAMAIGAENAAALQQKTMVLALAATARSVRLILDLETPEGTESPDLDFHSHKEP